MSKALVIFGSTTGNTETMAQTVAKGLEEAGMDVEVKNVTDCAPADMAGDCDLVVLGCPAYGDDSIELQDDFVDFYEDMDSVKLNGKPYAVFAPGDSSYTHFCGSVDMLEDKMEELGGKKATEGLKVDGDPDDADSEIISWAKSAAV